jgi:hypothetical protein
MKLGPATSRDLGAKAKGVQIIASERAMAFIG